MVEKVWQQVQESAGHMASKVRKQNAMNACTQLTFFIFFFVQSETPAHRLGPPALKMAHLSSIDLICIIPQSHVQRLVSMVSLASIKLVINTNNMVPKEMFSHEGNLMVNQVGSTPVVLHSRHYIDQEGAQGPTACGCSSP